VVAKSFCDRARLSHRLPSPITCLGDNLIPIELPLLRTECSKTFNLGGQNRQLVISGVQHYKDSYTDKTEIWKDIDLTPDSNGNITKAPYTLIVKNGVYTFTDKKTGDSIALTPQGSIKVIPFNNGAKFQRQILSDTDDITHEFGIKVKGTSVKLKCEATDAEGDSVPISYEIKNGKLIESITSLFKTSKDGKTKAVKFPITLDPTLTIQPSSKDTHLHEGNPTTNYGTSAYWVEAGYLSAGHLLRALIEFAITWGTDIPANATITSAVFSLLVDNLTSGTNENFTAARVLRRDWVEAESTWNIYKTGSNWTTAGCGSNGNDYTSTDAVALAISSTGWKDWTITNQVLTAQAGSFNVAIRVIGATTSGLSSRTASARPREYATAASRPKLVIN